MVSCKSSAILSWSPLWSGCAVNCAMVLVNALRPNRANSKNQPRFDVSIQKSYTFYIIAQHNKSLALCIPCKSYLTIVFTTRNRTMDKQDIKNKLGISTYTFGNVGTKQGYIFSTSIEYKYLGINVWIHQISMLFNHMKQGISVYKSDIRIKTWMSLFDLPNWFFPWVVVCNTSTAELIKPMSFVKSMY